MDPISRDCFRGRGTSKCLGFDGEVGRLEDEVEAVSCRDRSLRRISCMDNIINISILLKSKSPTRVFRKMF